MYSFSQFTRQYTKPDIDEHRGWVFGSTEGKALSSTSGSGSFPSSWGDEDPNMGAKTIRDIYERVNDTTERYILPVLWDKKLNTIVSNESSEIIRMLNSEFNEFANNPDLDLYPESHATKIDEINQWVRSTDILRYGRNLFIYALKMSHHYFKLRSTLVLIMEFIDVVLLQPKSAMM